MVVPLAFIVNKLALPSGILCSSKSSNIHKLWIGFVLLVTVVYILTEGAFYLVNIHDLNESTTCMGTLSFLITAFFRVVLLLKNNSKLKDLISRIQKISASNPSGNYLCKRAEKRSRALAMTFLCMGYLTLLFMMLSPLINMWLEYMDTGRVQKYRWELPFKMVFPFDHKVPEVHIALYIYVVVTIIPYVNPIMSVNSLYICCAYHIASLFKGLQGQALNMEFGKLFNTSLEPYHEFRENVKSFVDNHNAVIDLVNQMEEIFGGIFIVQYLGAIFAICTQAYLSTLNLDNGYFVTNILYMLTITFELFMYTYTGSKIIAESENLANVIWNLQWYEKEPRIRFYYQQIMQRCQKPCRILALKWMPSSLASFQSVISISFNIFNLLRYMNSSGKKYQI